jgi:hypothetical protein
MRQLELAFFKVDGPDAYKDTAPMDVHVALCQVALTMIMAAAASTSGATTPCLRMPHAQVAPLMPKWTKYSKTKR